jgi:hypothetical protein
MTETKPERKESQCEQIGSAATVGEKPHYQSNKQEIASVKGRHRRDRVAGAEPEAEAKGRLKGQFDPVHRRSP